MAKKELLNFVLEENPYYKMSKINTDQYEQEFWDINETISELSYLTHSYFRYYGKFPSKIGKLIIDDLDSRGRISPQNDFILDNYVGSGTTLVESKLHNYDSFGVDINPFAILACKVKTRNYDTILLRNYWQKLQTEITAYNHAILQPDSQQLLFAETSDEIKSKIFEEIKTFKEENRDAGKWFSENAITGLAIIKCLLINRPDNEIREFFELAFFAVIRRVSTAYDGEVRPHVNKKKKERNVADAYSKAFIITASGTIILWSIHVLITFLDFSSQCEYSHSTCTNVICFCPAGTSSFPQYPSTFFLKSIATKEACFAFSMVCGPVRQSNNANVATPLEIP